MPLYEFKCPNCQRAYDLRLWATMRDFPFECGVCYRTELERQLSRVSLRGDTVSRG